jgi:hypothetical protein
MPFGNMEGSFDDLTLSYDVAQNMLLSLDRGEPVQPSGFKAEYMVDRLNHRMSKPDYKFLPPQIQQLYSDTLAQYQDIIAEMEEKIIAAKNEYIPTEGPMVGVDMYVEAEDPTKEPKRARLPSRAVEWLVKTLEQQGASLQKMEQMEKQNLASLSDALFKRQGQAQGPAAPMPPLASG